MRPIHSIILHHSASPFGCVKVIRQWHQARGWKDCGYHCVIGSGHPTATSGYLPECDGMLEIGRPWDQVGAHATGHNVGSLGVCLIGYGHQLTRAQEASLVTLVTMVRALYPGITLIGHGDVGQTLCPGFDVPSWAQAHGWL